jgi:hypothetical protein
MDNEDSSSGRMVPDRRKKKGEAACNCASQGVAVAVRQQHRGSQ